VDLVELSHITYYVIKYPGPQSRYIVYYHRLDAKLKCLYMKLESMGILCHHCIAVIKYIRLKNIS